MTPEGIGAAIGTAILTVLLGLLGGRKVIGGINVFAKNSKDIKALTESNNTLSATCKRLDERVNGLNKDNALLQANDEKKTAEIKQLREQINKADDRQEKAEDRIRELEKVNASLEGRLNEQRKNFESIDERRQKQLEEAIVAKTEQTQRAADLESKLKIEQEKNIANLKVEQAKNAELTVKIDSIQAELTHTKQQLSQTQTELSEEKRQRVNLEGEVAALKTQMAALAGAKVTQSVDIPAAPPVGKEGTS